MAEECAALVIAVLALAVDGIAVRIGLAILEVAVVPNPAQVTFFRVCVCVFEVVVGRQGEGVGR